MSWVTVEEADAYFATRLGASAHWASGASKAAALATAYNDLVGAGRWDFTLASGHGIPDAWKVAQCEQALFLLANPDAEKRMALRAQGVTEAGIVKEQYIEGSAGVFLAPRAVALLAAYSVAGTGAIEIER